MNEINEDVAMVSANIKVKEDYKSSEAVIMDLVSHRMLVKMLNRLGGVPQVGSVITLIMGVE